MTSSVNKRLNDSRGISIISYIIWLNSVTRKIYLFSPFLLTSHSHGQYTAQSRSIIVCNSSIYFGTNPELKFWEKSKVCNIRHMHALNKTRVHMICPKNGINLFLVEFVCVIAIIFGNCLRLILYQN